MHGLSVSLGRASKQSSQGVGGFVGDIRVTKAFWNCPSLLTFSKKKKKSRSWLKYLIHLNNLENGPIFSSAEEMQDLGPSLWLLSAFINMGGEFNLNKCRVSY